MGNRENGQSIRADLKAFDEICQRPGTISFPENDELKKSALAIKRQEYASKARIGQKDRNAFEKEFELRYKLIDALQKGLLKPMKAFAIFHEIFGVNPQDGSEQLFLRSYNLIASLCDPSIEAKPDDIKNWTVRRHQ